MRVLVCGSCPERIFVGFILDRLNDKYTIDEVVFEGRGSLAGATFGWAEQNQKPIVWANTADARVRTHRMFNARPDMVLTFGGAVSDQIYFMAREARIPIGFVDELSGEIQTAGYGWGGLVRRIIKPSVRSLRQIERDICTGAVGAFELHNAAGTAPPEFLP